MSLRIAFIGVGNMASAIIGGLIASGYDAGKICGTSLDVTTHKALEDKFGMRMYADNSSAVANADVVFLSVKPQQMGAVIADFVENVREDQLFISVAAGIEVGSLEKWLQKPVSVVRCMPNTPALVGCGMTGLIANDNTTAEQRQWVSNVFDSFGAHVWVSEEQQMHTVTALSGSAPAYFFRFIEAMIEAGKAQGLDAESCRKLATYSMLGAAKMATELEEDIAQLRINITSPKGTTEQALIALEEKGIDAMVRSAVDACARRSQELAQEFAAN
ncbi:pyrroline-5-carboxylate reductase [Maribrevibacterium harenarium]|uniref:Pyrroline-5-carboxylate reductase n=1 Tax=Maribrevibacterium harenarium TaxID=2589817 RepID=A0A501WJU1_9GAMM|nr:pyrroline-5-carboxylate reductase [Maribrevibacterium harenarium]TPE49789.1 pyrroline-5-carboxylate reductase [Maribrevibacterium harenarium]